MANGLVEDNSKLGVHYFGFMVREKFALESMEMLFEEVRMKVWPDKQANPLVHRTKFRAGFRNLNLWAAKFEAPPVHGLVEKFEEFTSAQDKTLRSMRIRFSGIECRLREGRINVRLQPDPESRETLQKLQAAVIAQFKEFHLSGFEEVSDLSVSLLSLTTSKFTFEEFEHVIQQCNSDFRSFEVLLEPFIVSRGYEIFLQYPLPAEKACGDDSTEWISRSLCLTGFHRISTERSLAILRSIAHLIHFELHDDMVEKCSWEAKYYKRGRIVAVFASAQLSDSFYRGVRGYLARNGRCLRAKALGEGFSGNELIGVYKAMSRARDSLFLKARDLCTKRLRNYRPKCSMVTEDIYLKECKEPYREHYFKNSEELYNLAILLEKESQTEYLTVS